MFYEHLKVFNIVSTIFGLWKPFNTIDNNKFRKRRLWIILWANLVVISTTLCYFFFVNFNDYLDIKQNLPDIDGTNNLIVNILIIIFELINEDEVFVQIYNIIRNLFHQFKLNDYTIKMFSYKLYIWIALMSTLFFILIVSEFLYHYPPYVVIFKIPLFFTLVHLFIHLCLLLAFLKTINMKLSQSLCFNNGENPMYEYILSNQSLATRKRSLAYLLNAEVSFIDINTEYIDIKSLCNCCDDVITCVRLLEKNHGTQVFLNIWLMFSSAIIGITMIMVTEKILPWLIIAKTTELFIWYYLVCYLNEQMGKELEQSELLIIKYLINFGRDKPRRHLLGTFKQLVASNRIQFTSCYLFRLSYANILGIIVSVITYSIILNQLFWSHQDNTKS